VAALLVCVGVLVQADRVRVSEDFMSDFQSFGFVAVLTQGSALGWDMAAPLALNKSKRARRGCEAI